MKIININQHYWYFSRGGSPTIEFIPVMATFVGVSSTSPFAFIGVALGAIWFMLKRRQLLLKKYASGSDITTQDYYAMIRTKYQNG